MTRTATTRYKRAPSVVDATRPVESCLHLDRQTGQRVPCKSPSSGGQHTDEKERAPISSAKAFTYFNADTTKADFHDDNATVIPNAYLLSQLAGIAYRSPDKVEQPGEEGAYFLAEGLGLQHLPVIEDEYASFLDFGGPGGDTRAYIFYNDYAVFVAFEGSTGAYDWEESNLDIWPYTMSEWGHTDNHFAPRSAASIS